MVPSRPHAAFVRQGNSGGVAMRAVRKLLCVLSAVSVALLALAASSGTASAAGTTQTCSGSLQSPGVLAGHYDFVRVVGVCEVNAGRAVVSGNLRVEGGAVLIAAFALNDRTGTGASSLSVAGDVHIDKGGVLLLGCDPQSFACLDDSQNNPTLSSYETVGGNLASRQPLGVIVHNTSVGGSVYQDGGGGGLNCNPQGIFVAFNSPVFSDYEDSFIQGNLRVSNLTSCFLGIARVHVTDMRVNDNRLADPDAIEILNNNISNNLICNGNSKVWDSSEASFGQHGLYPRTPQPNTVEGQRSGQCVLASPPTRGAPPGPGPF